MYGREMEGGHFCFGKEGEKLAQREFCFLDVEGSLANAF